ncbi:MAG: hypothetical protein Q620_VSAC01004G0001 [Veillonella sp. DORA_A_3_16_22]|nr:MAG: hypothetical protein Q620_VSAC01004G0001 [Veillonella sp. DORA_A_3_16_22]
MFFSSITADYTKMGYPKAIVRALEFLKNTDLKALPGGRHAIEGDMMYANVDDVETKLFETTTTLRILIGLSLTANSGLWISDGKNTA